MRRVRSKLQIRRDSETVKHAVKLRRWGTRWRSPGFCISSTPQSIRLTAIASSPFGEPFYTAQLSCSTPSHTSASLASLSSKQAKCPRCTRPLRVIPLSATHIRSCPLSPFHGDSFKACHHAQVKAQRIYRLHYLLLLYTSLC